MFGSKRALGDNGLRNYLRRPPKDSVLWLPGLNPGGSTIWDYSGNGNNGTINGATWVRRPKGVWGLNFDGDDYVDCGNAASLQITNNLTVACWFKTPATFTTGAIAFTNAEGIMSKYLTTGDQRSWTIFLTNDALNGLMDELTIILSGDGLGANIYRGWYDLSLSVGTFYFVVMTLASGTLAVYLDGTAVTITTDVGSVPNTILNSTGTLQLAAVNDGAAALGKNQLYLPRVIGTTVLTAAQALELYQQERRWIGV